MLQSLALGLSGCCAVPAAAEHTIRAGIVLEKSYFWAAGC